MLARPPKPQIAERRDVLAQQQRALERREREALQAGLAQTAAVARRQGVAIESPDGASQTGPIITARDGFTWLCGSRKRKAQLSQAQIAAGLRHRVLLDAARRSRMTADYGRMEQGGGVGIAGSATAGAEDSLRRRMAAADRLARAEAALAAAHPAIALVTRRVVDDGLTLAAVATEQGKPEAAVLEVLRLGLDKLAEDYGLRTAPR